MNSIKDYGQRNIDLGIFPGSRESEIRNNLHLMIDCIQKNKKENIKIFYANESSREIIENLLPYEYHTHLVSGKDINKVNDCKKGTVCIGNDYT
jgi:lipid A disaccharide synthetase